MDELTGPGGGPLLDVRGLTTLLHLPGGSPAVVDAIDLRVERGETLCLVGESGCGKSMAALSILRLVPDPPAEIAAGRVLFDGRDLLALSPRELRAVRGRRVAMVFQEPSAALNPVHTVGAQVGEVLRVHLGWSRARVQGEVVELLRRVGIPDPEQRMRAWPHQLSGGMKQRVVIAMAMACGPDLLIADEPTTALDVTVQAQVLRLMKRLQQESGMGLLLITHDFGLVAEVADRVAVMYAGRIVEAGPVADLFRTPRHPYTRLLMASRPAAAPPGERRLPSIPGAVPPLLGRATGCAFAPRCPRASGQCAAAPALVGVGHAVACHHPEGAHG
ncbi:MAG: ABC transporter ATP-binding protein [Myxococcales bacterium]